MSVPVRGSWAAVAVAAGGAAAGAAAAGAGAGALGVGVGVGCALEPWSSWPANGSSYCSSPALCAQAPPAAAPQAELPYTGSPVDAGLLALAGGVLVASGLSLRVRLRERDGA